MKIALVLLLWMAGAAFGQTSSQHWIDSLKSAPVAEIEPGMPSAKFGEWFANMVSPAGAKYEIQECEASNGSDPAKPVCVQAAAELASGRTVELVFKISARAEKPAKIELLSGQLRPTNPMNKQPSRLVRKLSDLQALIQ